MSPVLSAPASSSPTRIGRPVWRGLPVASRRTRTAATRRQPTPPAATRDASSRPLHTATDAAPFPEQREISALVRQRHPQKREKDLLREETKRERALWNESSFNPQILVGRAGVCFPPGPQPTSLLCLWAPVPWKTGCLLCPPGSGPLARPCLCLSPTRRALHGVGVTSSGRGPGGIEGGTLPYSPVHGGLSSPGLPQLGGSFRPLLPLFPLHSGDPCFFTLPALLPFLSSFPSSPCLRACSPCPFLHDLVEAGLWGWQGERGPQVYYI